MFHESDEIFRRLHLLASGLKRGLAPVQHHEPVGDVEDMVDVVPDEHNRSAAGPHLPHEVENLVGFGERQRGRRLVEHDEVGLLVDGPRNGHALAFAAR